MLHIGEHIYGVVDQVPGVMHVGTRIVHFNFMPCVPVGSVVVLDKRITGEKTMIKTRFSAKSVAFAYIRLALLWGAIILMAIGFIAFDFEKMNARKQPPPWFQSPGLWMIALSVVSFLGWWFSHKLTNAGYNRAIAIADSIGLDREYIDESFRQRGLPIGDEPLPMAASAGWSNDEKDDVYRLE